MLPTPTPAPIDPTLRQITVRAIVTGMLIGALLSLCNIYSGLKIGWSNNMSVTAALIAFAAWRGLALAGARPFTLLENNLNQTAASSAAAVSSAGLVAGVPALTMLTGYQFTWPVLATWVLSVCLVGIAVGVGLRRQMIEIQQLPFPSGIASAETLREIHAAGSGAAARVYVLLAAGAAAAGLKLVEKLAGLKAWLFPGTVHLGAAGPVSAGNLTFGVEPSLLMVGVGGLIGLRAGLSILFGGLVAYLVLGPLALAEGWVPRPTDPKVAAGAWFGPLNKWLLWPGVAMMVTASLTSFAFSWRSIAATFRRRDAGADVVERGDVPLRWFVAGLVVATIFSVIMQRTLFGIGVFIAFLGVLLSFVLAMVGARVSGETNTTPIGAMGKVTQLVFGALTPGQVAPNLMAANVTGGAASQCADLMHDFKTGYLVGALARYQAIAQIFGALAGALVGSAAYLILIPDPATQLITTEWPAPAVATWKAVAEIFAQGFHALPAFTPLAAAIGGAVGIALAIAEKLAPAAIRRFLPSASAIGLAFVLPFYNSLQMCFGAVLAAVLTRYARSWSERFLVAAAAGIIAGESLMGVGISIQALFT
ncbi:MAG: OPT/YSL family transporter [Kofleriaceae bacterium]|nr:OPT/YSL family transporter [Kofleriaceae bacterium]